MGFVPADLPNNPGPFALKKTGIWFRRLFARAEINLLV